MKSKQVRAKDEASESVLQQPDSKADDQCAIDDIEKKKQKKEKLPKGFKEKIPVADQKITLDRSQIGIKGGGVYEIWNDDEVIVTDKIRIEGETELVHEINGICGDSVNGVNGRVSIQVTGNVLIGKRLKSTN